FVVRGARRAAGSGRTARALSSVVGRGDGGRRPSFHAPCRRAGTTHSTPARSVAIRFGRRSEAHGSSLVHRRAIRPGRRATRGVAERAGTGRGHNRRL